MKTKHTYGKWHAAYNARGNNMQIVGNSGLLADVYGNEANARLIAAAPDLLAALTELVAAATPAHHAGTNAAKAAARAAISRATGACETTGKDPDLCSCYRCKEARDHADTIGSRLQMGGVW